VRVGCVCVWKLVWFWLDSFVVVLAPNRAVPNERSLLACDVFSHIALRVQLQCLCAWRPSLILRCVCP